MKKCTLRSLALTLACGLGLIFQVVGQQVKFEQHTLEEGLSHPTIQCMMQDQQGFIWLGTQDGLNCWDGYSFKSYKHDPKDSTSISHSCVWALYRDKKGRIWAGNPLGLNLFDPATGAFKLYTPVAPHDSTAKSVHVISEDNAGRLMLGTYGGGLFIFDPDAKTFQHAVADSPILTQGSIFGIVRDEKENIWVGSKDGLLQVNLATRESILYRHDEHNISSLSSDYVMVVFKDRRGSVWVGTRNGLNRFVARTNSFEHFLHNASNPNSISSDYITSITEDSKGRLWIGTQNGLNLFDPITKSFKTYKNHPNVITSLSDNFVNCLFTERSGHVFIGTHGNGISVLDGRMKPFTTFSHDPTHPSTLSSNIVWSIFKDSQDRLWVGTNNGLNLFDRDTQTFQNHRQSKIQPHWFENISIMAIASDNDNRLWLGTERNGLIILDLLKKTVEQHQAIPHNSSSLPSNRVAAIHKDKAGRMWVGTFNGLSRFDAVTKTFTTYYTEADSTIAHPNFVNAIHENEKGQLWLSRSTGASLFDPSTHTFINFPHHSGDSTTISSNFVMYTREDQKQRVWFATDHGLNVLNNKTISTLHYGGLDYPGDYFYSVLEDNSGRLWSGTNKGLFRLTPATNFAPGQGRWGEIKNYTLDDGIQHNEFNIGASFHDKDGNFYLGGINGFTVFHPDSIKEDTYVPPVYIRELEVFNKPVQPGKSVNGFLLPASIGSMNELVLSYREAIFTLEFSALAYAQADKFQYAYQLMGFDKDWSYTQAGRRFATYTNLDPGSYTFRVKVANADGFWGNEHTLTIIITPPWWQTWWFRLIAVVTMIGIIGLFITYRTREIRKANLVLTLAVTQKTKEIHSKNEELLVQTNLLKAKNLELERAKGQLAFELQYQHQRELLKMSIDIQETERKRIAHDLHDELGAVLSIARMHLVHLESLPSSADTLQGLQQARTLTENALVTMRRISHELMPLQLQKYGFINTLDSLAQQINDTNGVQVNLITTDSELRWSLPAELGLYRITMELINNTLKHSKANQIQIEISQSMEHIVIVYTDNGIGLPSQPQYGMGLRSIDTRISALGGTFEIVSEPGTGFTARIIIPF